MAIGTGMPTMVGVEAAFTFFIKQLPDEGDGLVNFRMRETDFRMSTVLSAHRRFLAVKAVSYSGNIIFHFLKLIDEN